MTDETRNEIIRLARKQWPVSQIVEAINWRNRGNPEDNGRSCTEGQARQVIDEALAYMDDRLTLTVPQDTDAIGRIAKWFDDALVAGYDLKDAAVMAMGALQVLTDETTVRRLADQLDAEAEDRMVEDVRG